MNGFPCSLARGLARFLPNLKALAVDPDTRPNHGGADARQPGKGPMKGLQIFAHSFRLVMNNLGMALRVSLLLYLVQAALTVVQFLNPPTMQTVDGVTLPVMDPGVAFTIILMSIAAVVAGLWIAVAWHRFVLVEERPDGWLPQWHGSRTLAYLGRSLMIGIAVLVVVIVTNLLLGPVLQGLGAFGHVLRLTILGTLGTIVFLRLGVMLPAGTVDHRMTVAEAWTATKGESGTIVGLALVAAVATVLVQVPTMLNDDPGSMISMVYTIVLNWFVTMIGISVLTTLYGHLIEGRPID